MVQKNRTFRVFVSSTFKDMMLERDTLQERVFPRLRNLCESQGARFQAIDLRWGVSVQAQRDQQTMPLCIREIKRCREISPRPHFIFLLGQRYGWIPLPATIPASEFDRFQPVSKSDKDLIDAWYSRDDNAVPPVYRLQPRAINGVNPGDPGWAEAEAREESQWREIEEKLRSALNQAAASVLSGDALTRYSTSATEQEIISALFAPGAAPDAADHSFGFFRASDANDDANTISLKRRLKEELPANRLVTYNPVEESDENLKVFGDLVYQSLREVIEAELKTLTEEDPLAAEVRLHTEFGCERRRGFIGRKKAFRMIDRYMKKGGAAPLIVQGESGSGKSAFMAESRQRLMDRKRNAVIIERFIGATPESTNGRLLLRSICNEIDQAYNNAEMDLPDTYPELSKIFRERFALASEERPLSIFIDALDQFARDDPALNLDWVPSDLPEHARLIVSVIPGSILDQLTDRLPPRNFLKIEDLSIKEAEKLLFTWLGEANRKLQPHQKTTVLNGFKSCPRPLYLKLATEEAKRWVSSDHPDPLPIDIDGMVSAIINRLASQAEHGPVIVSHSLGFLAAARNGITEDEMLDLLSKDEAIISDLQRRSPNSPRVKRLPPVIWSRLRADLDPFLVQQVADGTLVMNFYHRALAEKINTMFAKPGTEGWHGILADYFASTAIVFEGIPNKRKLSELPHQLINARRRDELEGTLTDYRFLYNKNLVSGPQAIVDDCAYADRMNCGSGGIDAVEEMMRLSSNVVRIHPEQLPGQITGRLINHPHAAISKLLASIPEIHDGPWLQPLITPMARPGGPLLRTIDTGQGGISDLAASADGMMLVTAGRDGSVAVWDVAEGRELNRIGGHEQEIRHIALSPESSTAVTVSYSELGIWNLNTGLMQHMIDMGRGWPGPAAVLDERLALVGSVDSTISLIDMVAGKVVRRLKGHDKKVESIDAWGSAAVSADARQLIVWDADALRRVGTRWIGQNPIHKIDTYGDGYPGGGLLVAVGPGGQAALTLRADDSGSCMLWDLKSGLVKRRFPKIRESWGSRVCSSRDQDRFVLGVSERSVGHSDKYGNDQLYLANGDGVIRSLQVGSVWGLAVSADGKKAFTGGRVVSVWDLDALESGSEPVGIPALSAVDISDISGAIFGCDDEGILLKISPISGSFERIGEAAGRVVDLAVSDNEDTLLAVLEDGKVAVWQNGVKQPTIAIPGSRIETVELTGDGREAVITGRKRGSLFSNEVRWRLDVSNGQVIDHSEEMSKCLVLARRTGQIACVGGYAVHSGMRAVRLRNLPEGPAFAWVQALAVDGIGERIAASTSYYCLQVWDTIAGEQVAELAFSDVKDGEHETTGGPVSLWLSSDGRWCLAASSDCTLNLWEVGADHPAAVYSLDESPSWVGATEDGSIIAVKDDSGGLYTFKIKGVSLDVHVKAWELQEVEAFCTLDEHTNVVDTVVVTPDGCCAVSSSRDKTIKVWDLETGRSLRTLEGHKGEVYAVTLTADGRRVVSYSRDHTIRVWDLESGNLFHILKGHAWAGSAIALTEDGGYAISGSGDKTIKVWDLRNGGLRFTLKGHTGEITSVAVTPNGAQAISGSTDNTIRVWDLQSGEELHKLKGHTGLIKTLDITPNGRQVISGSVDNTIRVWDLQRGEALHTLQGHAGEINAVVTTPDGTQAISCSWDSTIKVWDLEDGKLVHTLKGHAGAVYSVAVTHDGQRVISGSADKTIIVWDLENGDAQLILKGHTREVKTLALTPDGTRVVSGSWDDTLKVWKL